ncbi:hypothetical protein EZV62_027104 [Acer yangbiense]|uniref:Uncharacterized protein n=1 Tax=Acer yangbiense TaxID=1000413 RepID=A0A5C7GTC0_9ROSI|nr:hypothetical protein EZV62_027104 [Acer yangbiense]
MVTNSYKGEKKFYGDKSKGSRFYCPTYSTMIVESKRAVFLEEGTDDDEPLPILNESQPVIYEPEPVMDKSQPAVDEPRLIVDVPLRRSHRVRRSAIPDDYIVYLQEHDFDLGVDDDPITYGQDVQSSKSSDWMDAMIDELRSMDTNQVWDFPEFFTSSDKGFEELKITIEGFKKEEDDLKERINHLMVKFSNSKLSSDSDVLEGWTAVGEQEQSKDESHFIDKGGLKGLKDRDNYYKETNNRDDSTNIAEDFEEIGRDDAVMSDFCVGTGREDDCIDILAKNGQLSVELGADVCCMLGDLMFRLSERKQVLEQFHEIRSALESLIKNMENIARMVYIWHQQQHIRNTVSNSNQMSKWRKIQFPKKFGTWMNSRCGTFHECKSLIQGKEEVMGDFEEIEAYLNENEMGLEEEMSELKLAREALLDREGCVLHVWCSHV